MVAKAGLGLIGLGALGVGGVALAKPGWLGMGGDPMPEFHALSKDSDFSTGNNYPEGNFGKKYKNYLIGVTTKNGANNKTNQSWWEWAYRRLQEDNISKGKFKVTKEGGKKVESAYNKDNDDKALNQVCKAAYKTGNEDSNFDENDLTGSKFKKSEIWKYCSPLGKEPEKIGNNEYAGQIGSATEENFISVKDGVNDMFWSIREKEIQGKDNNFEKVPSEDITSEHFKKRNLTMKELCKQAYETKTNPSSGDTTSPTKEDTKKYCKFEIS